MTITTITTQQNAATAACAPPKATPRNQLRAALRTLIQTHPAVTAMALYVAGRGLPEAPIVGPHCRIPPPVRVVLH